jgi:endoglucanase
MAKADLALLEELTQVEGVPGHEADVAGVLERHMAPLGTVSRDKLGSILCCVEGKTGGPRIMLPAHMDEIGFMVRQVTDDGYVKFTALGGWWEHVMLSQRVTVKTTKGRVLGIIGCKPPHALEDKERNAIVKRKHMYIDVGARDKKQAETKFGIRPGDPIVPVGPFTPIGDGSYLMAKAWDDRVGCGVMIETLRVLKTRGHPNTVLGVGTVQEEIGVRGARTSAWKAEPDVAIVCEVGIAHDTPGATDDKAMGQLGKGPQITLFDSGMIPNLRLRDLAIAVAKKARIPHQICLLERGTTDGHIVHMHQEGVPSLVIAVPARYIHSHNGIIHRRDYENGVRLLAELIRRLDAATVRKLA